MMVVGFPPGEEEEGVRVLEFQEPEVAGEGGQAPACVNQGPAPVGKGADGEGVGGGKDLQQGVKREGGVCAGAAQAEGDQGENT